MRFGKQYKIHKAASDGPTLHGTEFIQYDKKRETLTATDGHIFAIVPCEPEPEDVDAVFPSDVCGLSFAEKDTHRIVIDKKQVSYSRDESSILHSVDNLAGTRKVPDVSALLPPEGMVNAIHIDAKKLYTLAQALGSDAVVMRFDMDATDSKGASCPKSCIRVEAANSEAVGGIMPRTDKE